MSVRLWEERRLLDLDLLSSDRDALMVKRQLSMTFQFLHVVSLDPENLVASGLEWMSLKILIGHPLVESESIIHWMLKV